ncbi:BRI1 kinase inhibitor 1-like [Bidens hawaiensis]|uniref:BRI1 kinase inhibitor 1-like n=1 Tax=Bidens hawaiensis TaxID=980011 RepID=UPI00404A001B
MRDYKIQKEHDYMKIKQDTIISLQESMHNTSSTHEFSFTISLDPNPPPKSTHNGNNHNNNNNRLITPPTPEPVTAIDLSPADDIFFQGHLLPLHPSISPRSSTHSMDSFTLPTATGNTSFRCHHHRNTFSDLSLPLSNINQTKPKYKSFSIFNRPDSKNKSPDEEETGNPKKKLKLEVTKFIKRYMKMFKPFMSFRRIKKSNNEYNRQPPHSFSSNCLSSRSSLPVEMNRGVRRGRFSAPASIRTSPANSGILASGTLSPAKSTASDSTMEELQAAIQAAIAHCKNSIASEDKVQA